jgi:hypothetical protein
MNFMQIHSVLKLLPAHKEMKTESYFNRKSVEIQQMHLKISLPVSWSATEHL